MQNCNTRLRYLNVDTLIEKTHPGFTCQIFERERRGYGPPRQITNVGILLNKSALPFSNKKVGGKPTIGKLLSGKGET